MSFNSIKIISRSVPFLPLDSKLFMSPLYVLFKWLWQVVLWHSQLPSDIHIDKDYLQVYYNIKFLFFRVFFCNWFFNDIFLSAVLLASKLTNTPNNSFLMLSIFLNIWWCSKSSFTLTIYFSICFANYCGIISNCDYCMLTFWSLCKVCRYQTVVYYLHLSSIGILPI